jgi:hypothetical protein
MSLSSSSSSRRSALLLLAPLALLLLLLALCAPSLSSVAGQEYASFDGFYHNQHVPEWGAIGEREQGGREAEAAHGTASWTSVRERHALTVARFPRFSFSLSISPHWLASPFPSETPFLRMGGSTWYADKTYEPMSAGRPSARLLSNELFTTPPSQESLLSTQGRTALLAFYGQQLYTELHDGRHAGCPVEYFNIAIPKCDATFDPLCTGKAEMPFTRTKYLATSGQGPSTPRAQLSENSAWLDGGSIYGNGKTWSDQLRTRAGGLLNSKNEDGKFPAVSGAKDHSSSSRRRAVEPKRSTDLLPVSRTLEISVT